MNLQEAVKKSFGAAHRCADLTETLWSDGAGPEPGRGLEQAQELVRHTRCLSASALEIEARLLRIAEPKRG